MRRLREALGFKTQASLADASPDGSLERTYVVRAEGGMPDTPIASTRRLTDCSTCHR